MSIVSTLFFDVLLKKTIPVADVNFLLPFGGWFLITLFLMELIIAPIITFVRNKKIVAVITLLFLFTFFLVTYKNIQYIQQTLVAVVFGLLGFLMRPMIEKYETGAINQKGFGWLILLFVAIFSQYNEPVGMYINQYGNKLMFFINSVIGILGVLDISTSIKDAKFLQWCGRTSIIIYVLQFFLIRSVKAFIHIAKPSLEDSTFPNYIIIFITVLVILVPLTLLCEKYLYFIFGRNKGINN